jgi:hypothetical protein
MSERLPESVPESLPESMQAAVYHCRRDLRIESRPRPEPLHEAGR